MAALVSLTAHELGARYRSGEATPTQAATEHLARIAPRLAGRVELAGGVELAGAGASDDATERHLLFEAVSDLLRRLAAISPLVVVLDDVQWAEPTAVQLLRHLGRALVDAPVLLVLLARDTDERRPRELRAALAELERRPGRRICLGGFDDDELAGLTASLLAVDAGAVTAAVCARLHEQSAGNPLYAIQLVRHWAESGQLAVAAAGVDFAMGAAGDEVPASLRNLIWSRVSSLGDEVLAVLSAAAVLGTQFDAGAVIDMAGISESDAMDAILLVLRTGMQWNALKDTTICSSSSAHRRFQEWEQAGVFHEIWRQGLLEYDTVVGIDWAWLAARQNYALAVLLYVAMLLLIGKLLGLPLDFYSFRLEHRYNLSNQKLRSWAWDQVKGWLVGLVLGSIVAELIYWTIRQAPQRWWLLAWAAFTALAVFLAQIAPVVLFPLFYKFQPLENEDLRERLVRLSERAGTRVRGVYEWKLSEKSKKANAALTGLGRTRRIILADTLLENYSPEEIESILAHELGHHVHRHIVKGILVQVVITFFGFWATAAILRYAVEQRHMFETLTDFANLPLLALVSTVMSVLLMPALNAYSRYNERQADRYAFESIASVEPFVSSMNKLAEQNLAERVPSKWVEWFFHSHPSISRRLAAAESWNKAQSASPHL